MTREDLAGMADGATLATAASGLEIVRRRKHEPIPLSGLLTDQVRDRNSPGPGSKFHETWPLNRYVEGLLGWLDGSECDLRRGARGWRDVSFTDPVGLADGLEVHTIRVDSDGRYVHAYPVEDRS